MELRVLGELPVEMNGATVRLRPAERRLVAGLAVGRASQVRYDALAEAVWGDRVPASAKHSLQSHVLRIRAATRDELVQTVPGGYRLGEGVTLDIDAFESAVERAGDADVNAAARCLHQGRGRSCQHPAGRQRGRCGGGDDLWLWVAHGLGVPPSATGDQHAVWGRRSTVRWRHDLGERSTGVRHVERHDEVDADRPSGAHVDASSAGHGAGVREAGRHGDRPATRDGGPLDPAIARKVEGTSHPLVRTHPVTGERALYCDKTYASGIEGLTEAESEPLMTFLSDHATQPAFTCRLRWSPGTFAVWDNRLCLHQAFNDHDGFRRELYRTTVAGEVPS